MGLWSGQILPRFVAWGMSGRVFSEQRGPALEGVSGRVLELGAGAGLNLPHYPGGVEELVALEPARVNRKLARKRVDAALFPVAWIDAPGERIPLEDASVDFVTSTWTLCTIPDVPRALAEVRRVLRAGGALVFLEHGLSPDPKVARRQRRLTPLQKRVCGGCHFDRPIDVLLRDAGFALERLDHPEIDVPKIARYLYRGWARPE